MKKTVLCIEDSSANLRAMDGYQVLNRLSEQKHMLHTHEENINYKFSTKV